MAGARNRQHTLMRDFNRPGRGPPQMAFFHIRFMAAPTALRLWLLLTAFAVDPPRRQPRPPTPTDGPPTPGKPEFEMAPAAEKMGRPARPRDSDLPRPQFLASAEEPPKDCASSGVRQGLFASIIKGHPPLTRARITGFQKKIVAAGLPTTQIQGQGHRHNISA